MKKLLLIILFFLFICIYACTNESDTKRILQDEGYTNIELTGYDPWGCGEDDTYSTGFTATNKNGKKVKGVVCGGITKGYTIRMK
jgi:hypothetical protein